MEESFIQLVTQHKALIYKVCRTFRENDPEGARDLFQDIVAELWRAFPRYNGTAKWTTWAYRIALYVAITQQRRRKLHMVPFTGMEPPPVPEPNEQLAALHQAIVRLNEPDKALILLYLDDLSYADMAEITGLTETHIGVKLSRIKSKLKNLLFHGKS
ncbi:MAG TPA: RNA polymerase subunit sigma-70 [Saprospirales bacterium]|nr:RNA polymerase subunit sigma-70 [Saprospirales bacterium]